MRAGEFTGDCESNHFMPMTDDDLPEDYDALKAAFIEMRAKCRAEALIAHLQLVIAKMKRELYGRLGAQPAA